jgi:hypothetical protein
MWFETELPGLSDSKTSLIHFQYSACKPANAEVIAAKLFDDEVAVALVFNK